MIDAINGFLGGFDPKLTLGAAALVGALIHSGYTIYKKKKEDKKFKFDSKKFIDTVWQSTLAGVLIGTSIGGNISGCVIAMLTGVGVDTATNKVVILNIVQFITGFMKKKKK